LLFPLLAKSDPLGVIFVILLQAGICFLASNAQSAISMAMSCLVHGESSFAMVSVFICKTFEIARRSLSELMRLLMP